MTLLLSSDTVAEAFLKACHAELHALKPGNVHVYADGHDMTVADFEASAKASAPALSDPNLDLGERIKQAVTASFSAVKCNTNLGIILLCAPLAQAVLQQNKENAETEPLSAHNQNPKFKNTSPLRQQLSDVLENLTTDDASHAFEAIALAQPGGLGTSEEHDVRTPPAITLGEAMAAAADRDRIAKAYTNAFEDVFAFGLPASEAARKHAQKTSLTVTTLHLDFLANIPDTHIARKFGSATSEHVQKLAKEIREKNQPTPTEEAFEDLLNLDSHLKSKGWNPGTTADFVVATLFADALNAKLR